MRKEIFIVDDDPDHHFLVYKVIKGFDGSVPVRFFEDGKVLYRHLETLGRQARSDQFPALVIVDLNMPGMNGLQLLRQLRNPRPELQEYFDELPVVIMSAEKGVDKIQQCYQQGANAYIIKPMELEKIRYTLQSIFKFWLGQDMQPVANVVV